MKEIIRFCIYSENYLYKLFYFLKEHNKLKRFEERFKKREWSKSSESNIQFIFRYCVLKINKSKDKHDVITSGRIATILMDSNCKMSVPELFSCGKNKIEEIKSSRNKSLFHMIEAWPPQRKINFYFSLTAFLLFPLLCEEIRELTIPIYFDPGVDVASVIAS